MTCKYVRHACMRACMHGCMHGWKDACMDGRMDGWTDVWQVAFAFAFCSLQFAVCSWQLAVGSLQFELVFGYFGFWICILHRAFVHLHLHSRFCIVFAFAFPFASVIKRSCIRVTVDKCCRTHANCIVIHFFRRALAWIHMQRNVFDLHKSVLAIFTFGLSFAAFSGSFFLRRRHGQRRSRKAS